MGRVQDNYEKMGSTINDYNDTRGIKKGNKHVGLQTVGGAWVPTTQCTEAARTRQPSRNALRGILPQGHMWGPGQDFPRDAS